MSLERMVCCGALTHVYGDQLHRRHKSDCAYWTPDPEPLSKLEVYKQA